MLEKRWNYLDTHLFALRFEIAKDLLAYIDPLYVVDIGCLDHPLPYADSIHIDPLSQHPRVIPANFEDVEIPHKNKSCLILMGFHLQGDSLDHLLPILDRFDWIILEYAIDFELSSNATRTILEQKFHIIYDIQLDISGNETFKFRRTLLLERDE